MQKNAIIFGDSYSTFAGYIPDGYAIYYSETERAETGITQVSQTWWHQVCREAGFNLVQNNSWSGSTIGHTGFYNADCSRSSSFIYRLRKLTEDGFFEENEIHTAFVFGGTNDSWLHVPLGEEKYSGWEENELFSVLPAVTYFLNLLKKTLPRAEIFCLINTEMKPEITACMEKACKMYGITPVTFEKIDKKNGHPTVQGMVDIKDRVLQVMGQKSAKR